MGLLNKIFSSSSSSNSDNHQYDNKRKRASSINNGSLNSISKLLDTRNQPVDNNDECSRNTNLNKSDTHYKSKDNQSNDKHNTLDNMAKISRAYTTGQLLNKKTVAISDFLEYWRKENLAMFHPEKNSKDKLSYKPGSGSSFSVENKNNNKADPLRKKSCFKRGTLMEHKKRLLEYQRLRMLKSNEDGKPNKSKTKSNLSKILFGSNKSSAPNDNNKLPLRKWSSQPNLNVDKECEYDLYGMNDYYDDEDHSQGQNRTPRNNDLLLIENTRANSNTSLVSLDSMNSDTPASRILDQLSSGDESDSDNSSELNIPIISPITSIDEKGLKHVPHGL
ncbi:unnamed protein product [Hanseniaspora opuntiae]